MYGNGTFVTQVTAYDLKMSFGLDMDSVILKATSGEIGFEIDRSYLCNLAA